MLGEDADRLEPAEKEAQAALRGWQIFTHDPGRPDAERRRLRAALNPFSDELRSALGFDVAQADAIIGAFDGLITMGIAQTFGHGPREDLHSRLGEEIGAGRALEPIPRELGERASTDAETLREIASVLGEEISPEALGAFLERFSMPFGAIEEGRDPIRMLWDVRERPLLRDADENYTWTIPYNLAFAVRPVCERAIRELGGKARSRYDKAKAAALEIEALEELNNGLMSDGAWRTLSYPNAAHSDQEVEGDGLVLLDSVALTVECKAVELSPSARKGSAKALASKLQDTIVKGAAQAQRTREALLGSAEVTGVVLGENDRETIEAERLSRVLPIVVVLEPLGAVTSALWRLIELPETDATWPWVVNIDDLRWFDRLLTMPARLLHYAVVRQRIAAGGRLGAVDEADWLWMYYSQGAAAMHEKLELLGQIDAQRTQFVGPDVRRGGALPAELSPIACEALLIELHQTRLPGWVEVALALLDLSADADKRLADALSEAREEARTDRASWFLEAPPIAEGSLLLAGVGTPELLGSELPERLEHGQELAESKAATRICVVGIDVRTGEPVLCDWHPVAEKA